MSDPIPFRAVLEDELTALIPPAERASRSRNLSGLALSGGGIRSATFNLGVIQALLAHRQLSRFDYLSTVSGGGYIGSWLSALIKRLGQGDVGKLEAAFDVNGDGTVRARFDAAVHFLRRYSNYLTPRLGIFGADMMTAVSIYWRNLVLNLAMIALIFAGLVFAPYPITGFFSTLQLELRGWTLLVAALLIVLAAILVGLGSRPPRFDRTAPAWFEKPDVMAALIGTIRAGDAGKDRAPTGVI